MILWYGRYGGSLVYFKARPPGWRPPPLHLEAAAAYHIIVSIGQMMAMGGAACFLWDGAAYIHGLGV